MLDCFACRLPRHRRLTPRDHRLPVGLRVGRAGGAGVGRVGHASVLATRRGGKTSVDVLTELLRLKQGRLSGEIRTATAEARK